MFGVVSIPLLIGIGVAVDHGSNISKQNRIQAALDAGALAAAASNLTEAERQDLHRFLESL